MADTCVVTTPINPQEKARRFSRRWWLIAAIAFAGINLLLSPVTLMLLWSMLVAIGFGGAPLPQQWLAALVVIVIIPGLLAGGLATLLESQSRRLWKPGPARRWGWQTILIIVVLASPLVFLPVMFFRALDGLGGTKEEQEAAQQRSRRPIGESDSVGFCSVPQWTVVDGKPRLSIAVRVAEAGSYAVMVQGSYGRRQLSSGAWSEQGLTGMTIHEFGPGVDTMTVKFGEGMSSPIEWPVRMTYFDLSHSDGTGFIDIRRGDSLYVLDERGLRESIP